MVKALLFVVLAAALTGCGKSQPPVGKWEGGYEGGGDLVAARVEVLASGQVKVMAPDITNAIGPREQVNQLRAQLTADLAKTQHLPPCVAGHNYRFEPVPTDIELGPDGMLYATALTAAVFLGAPAGEVFQINPNTGATKLYASGFQGATGLAVTGNGTIYVAELFGNRISRVVNGHPTPFLAVNQPGDVEWDQSTKPGSLYATVNVLNPKAGTLLRIQP